MAVLYLRNVSDDLMRRLKLLASREQTSVSAAALRELDEATRWVDVPDLFENLPDVQVPTAEILAALDEGRSTR
ncbi:MAG: antitoxin [Acidimicrobiaceae bacterium]|nr:antitoxin [Acidimicrobiaceae bacterium]MXZ98104.1 antitoxin [Acidimicrobiaceae bacterium]MYE76021.1 antitoxin [Acidimicrobiaceae bacterium]MYE97706.1 antitoxin [Acidimicrobiaceae bacterium]MYH43845.1 antitoxin [Acidimicrobiaceae bacterium]